MRLEAQEGSRRSHGTLEVLSWGHWGAMEGFSRRGGAVLVGVLEFLTWFSGKRGVCASVEADRAARWSPQAGVGVWAGMGAAGRERSGW